MADICYYWGCAPGRLGHNLYAPSMKSDYKPKYPIFGMLDGVLVKSEAEPYKINHLEFDGIGYAVLSWADNSVDHRRGSNSILFIPHDESYNISECLWHYFTPVARNYHNKGIILKLIGMDKTVEYTIPFDKIPNAVDITKKR